MKKIESLIIGSYPRPSADKRSGGGYLGRKASAFRSGFLPLWPAQAGLAKIDYGAAKHRKWDKKRKIIIWFNIDNSVFMAKHFNKYML